MNNKYRKEPKWSKDEISQALVDSKTYKAVLLKLGVQPHRHWRLVLRELLSEYNLDFKSYHRKFKPKEELLETRRKNHAARRERLRYMRKHNLNTAQFIYTDSKSSDRKKGLKNDLNQEFIKKLIDHPCSYCGETSLRMTLDRIDNSIGHIRTNVVAACIRCNYVRRDMPYEAWLCIAPAMTEARKKGLFKNWSGRTRYTNPLKNQET